MIDKQKIEDFINQFYTHDYGQVYWNKEDGDIFIIGGDGGIVYWTGTEEDLKGKLQNEGIDDEDEEEIDIEDLFYNFFEKYGVTDVNIEAEYSLEDWCNNNSKQIEKYVLIGKMNDLSNILN